MAVAESAQKHGHGTELIQAVNTLAEQLKVDQVRLIVWAFNTQAITFYEKIGFSTAHFRMIKQIQETAKIQL